MEIERLYEDNHLLVVNKPNGLLVHGDKTGDDTLEEMMKSYIKTKYHKPGNVFLKATHRLDRPVSGVLVLGRTSKGHERMMKVFRERDIEKTYWALTTRMPNPDHGRIAHFLYKDYAKNVVHWRSEQVDGAREAVTDYRVLAHCDPYFLIELKPLTGRSHQLRVAMRSKRCPIAGDVKYNGRKISNPRAILLHARSLNFIHPIKREPITLIADPPSLKEWEYVQAVIPR